MFSTEFEDNLKWNIFPETFHLILFKKNRNNESCWGNEMESSTFNLFALDTTFIKSINPLLYNEIFVNFASHWMSFLSQWELFFSFYVNFLFMLTISPEECQNMILGGNLSCHVLIYSLYSIELKFKLSTGTYQ